MRKLTALGCNMFPEITFSGFAYICHLPKYKDVSRIQNCRNGCPFSCCIYHIAAVAETHHICNNDALALALIN